MTDVRPLLRLTAKWIQNEINPSDFRLVMRLTRQWIHYGIFAHTVICTVVGAVEGVMGR